MINRVMRGRSPQQISMLCLLNVESLIPAAHPLRPIKALADTALKLLSRNLERMYSRVGRPSVPPERLLKGMLLMAFYSIRSEAQFCERLRYDLLFRWFLDMDMVEEPFDHSGFSDNRGRLLDHDIAAKFFRRVVDQAQQLGLMSQDHFSVDGTLIEAHASMKSFKPKGAAVGDSNGWSDFRGQKRSNETHESTTDPDARLFRKGNGQEAKLAFMGHVFMENRNGLLKDILVTIASGRAEREAALDMIQANVSGSRATMGADAGYDARAFVEQLRDWNVTPHVAQKRHSAIDRRTTSHLGYELSQRVRKRAEQIFGWLKVIGGLRRTRYKGRERNQLLAYMTGAAYNLLRMTRLMHAPI